MIVCLGWGSLITDPGDLPVVGGWHPDGPSLPLEFARESEDGRMTLVIVEHDRPVPVMWSQLDVTALDRAREALLVRERARRPGAVGVWPSADDASPHARLVGE